MDERHPHLAAVVGDLLDNTFGRLDIVSHHPSCPYPAERCMAYAVLEEFEVEDVDAVLLRDVTDAVRRWFAMNAARRHPERN